MSFDLPAIQHIRAEVAGIAYGARVLQTRAEDIGKMLDRFQESINKEAATHPRVGDQWRTKHAGGYFVTQEVRAVTDTDVVFVTINGGTGKHGRTRKKWECMPSEGYTLTVRGSV